MDEELAGVASMRIGDVPPHVLEEVFHCLNFFDILGMRRVCRHWHAEISRDSAVFTRQVVIFLDKIFGSKLGSQEDGLLSVFRWVSTTPNMWQFAGKAETVVIMEERHRKNSYAIEAIRALYATQVREDQRACLIDKAIYLNMVVSSWDFDLKRAPPVVIKPGFQTVLCRSTLRFEPFDVLHDTMGEEANWPSNLSQLLCLDIEKDTFVLSKAECVALEHEWYDVKPAVVHFATRNVLQYTEEKLSTMRKALDKLNAPGFLKSCTKKLLKRFKPEADGALKPFASGDLESFARITHPLVPFFLHKWALSMIAEENRCEFSEVEEDGSIRVNAVGKDSRQEHEEEKYIFLPDDDSMSEDDGG